MIRSPAHNGSSDFPVTESFLPVPYRVDTGQMAEEPYQRGRGCAQQTQKSVPDPEEWIILETLSPSEAHEP